MFHIVLFQPEIPPNTGNIIRLCANTGMHLHLIQPLGFELDDKRMRRAGLDYHEYARVQVHEDLAGFIAQVKPPHIYACSTRGRRNYAEVSYAPGDALLFGPETKGLPQALLDELGSNQVLRLPMQENSRSLNLSNAVAIFAYEAWRQNGFAGAAD
jgi:tRNA (cytidine/uridine-2'-O-)-methyltransferase